MRLGRILYPVKALGPGERLGIWVQGCLRDCDGCANPELQSMDKPPLPTEMFISMCVQALKSYSLDGITITGGEPMLQAGELSLMLDACRPVCPDVLVFTGYTIEELREKNDKDINDFLSKISVLVDGPFVKDKNKGEILKGSSNQRIIYLDENYREKYENYISENRHIVDSFAADGGIISAGIHPAEGNEKWPVHQSDLK